MKLNPLWWFIDPDKDYLISERAPMGHEGEGKPFGISVSGREMGCLFWIIIIALVGFALMPNDNCNNLNSDGEYGIIREC